MPDLRRAAETQPVEVGALVRRTATRFWGVRGSPPTRQTSDLAGFFPNFPAAVIFLMAYKCFRCGFTGAAASYRRRAPIRRPIYRRRF